jgi:hypothetical protein
MLLAAFTTSLYEVPDCFENRVHGLFNQIIPFSVSHVVQCVPQLAWEHAHCHCAGVDEWETRGWDAP